ncbi:MAG: hypothetical protein WC876_11370 [Candidatus Thermoplasmatota archaeon]|jgi:hypothetical protein
MADPESLLAVLLPVIVGLALIAIANVVVRSGRDHRHNLFFAGLYFLSGLKSMSEGLAVAADDFHASAAWFPPRAFWDLLGIFCALGMMPLLLLFVSSFPRPVAWMQRAPRRAVLAFLPSAVVALLLVLFVTGGVPSGLYVGAAQAFNVFFFAVTVIAIVLLLRTRSRSPDAIERNQATYVLLGFLPAFITGWAVSAIQLGSGILIDAAVGEQVIADILHFVSPLLELVACSLVGFAILKYNILGINPKFRLGVKSMLAGMMFITLFMVTQFIENVILQGKVFSFAGDYGSFILSGATGIVLFKPIEKVSGRVSDKLLPGAAAVAAAASPSPDGPAPEATAAALLHAEQIYHAQCTYVLRDAQVTEREMALLRNLRTQLGLSEAQARRVEEDVERLLKVDAPETGQASVGSGPAPQSATTTAAEVASGDLDVRRGAKEPPQPPAKTPPDTT